jgi:hypothetical protein
MDLTNQTDITNFIFRWIVPLLGCVAAAMATVYMMQEVNPLAAFCACISLIFFAVSVVSTRAGLLVLLFSCAYSDLLKRLLVFWGDLSFEQVSYVLAMAPLVVAGLFVSVITQWAFHRVEIKLRDVLLMGGVGIAMVLSFLLNKRGGGDTLESMKQAANSGLYMVLAPIALKILQNASEIEKLLLKTRIIFIPVALYGIWQSFFGLADFEIEYLKSGLTMMVKELFDIRPKPFSTLNSAGSLGTLTAGLAVLSLYPLLVKRTTQLTFFDKFASIGLFLLYLAASLVSMVRASVLVWMVALFGVWCFRSAARTRVFYWSAIGSFMVLIASSSYILSHIAEWDPANGAESAIAGQALRLQTYSERLKGFVNLTNSTDMYSLFGLPEDQKMRETTYNHDPLSTLLVDVGVVGLVAVIVPFVLIVRFLHKRLLGLPPGAHRDIAVLLVAINAGWLVSHLLFHSVISGFPVNAFFWLFGGMAGALLIMERPSAEVPETDTAPTWSRAPEMRLGYAATHERFTTGSARARRVPQ